jgi:hypothetical protein
MSNPTSAFGWQMPTSSDLVTDLPADFEVFGQAVDTSLADLKGGTTGQILSKASSTDMDFTWTAAGLTNPMTTTGDTIYSSSGSTAARLAIGTTGQILTVSGGVPIWASPSSGTETWSLLNSGGTNLSGSATVTVSGISGKSRIMVVITDASSGSASSTIGLQLNTDTTSIYSQWGNIIERYGTYGTGNFYGESAPNNPYFILGQMSNDATSKVHSSTLLSNCNSTSYKIAQIAGGVIGSGNGGTIPTWNGFYTGTSAISSVSIYSNTGNFDGGKVWVYAA